MRGVPAPPNCAVRTSLSLSLSLHCCCPGHPPPVIVPIPPPVLLWTVPPPVVVPVPVVVIITRHPCPSPKSISTVLACWWHSIVRFNARQRIKMGNRVNAVPDYDGSGSDICWDISIHQRQGRALLTSFVADYYTALLLLLSSPSPSGSASA